MGVASTTDDVYFDNEEFESVRKISDEEKGAAGTRENTNGVPTTKPPLDTRPLPPPPPKQSGEAVEPWQDRKINGHSKVFPESTHSYLVYYRHDRDINGLLVSIAVLFIQFLLYSVILTAGIEEVRKAMWMPVRYNSWNCFFRTVEEETTWVDTNLLQCEPTLDDFEKNFDKLMASFALSCVLFTIFLKYDFLACVKVWYVVDGRWANWSAVILFIESIYAFIAGSTFISVGVLHASSYEAIMNSIGVLFVHDIDEKMFKSTFLLTDELMEMIKNSISNSACAVKCCGRCVCCKPLCDKFAESWCILFVMVLVVIMGMVLFQIYASLTVIDNQNEWKSWADNWGYDWDFAGYTSINSSWGW